MQTADATSANPSRESSLRRLPTSLQPKGERHADTPPDIDQGFSVHQLPKPLRAVFRVWYAHRLGRLETKLVALEIELKRLTDAGLKYQARDRLKQNQYLYAERACVIVRLKALDRVAERREV
jgi:hypothetical protein